MKRPSIVWLTQSLLILFAVLVLSAFLLNVAILLTHWDSDLSIVRIIIVYAVWLSIVLLLAVAFWGMAKRRNYGRWLGVLSLLLFWGFLILMKLQRPSGPYKYYEFDNTAQLAGAVAVQVVLHGLILVLILRLSFSKSVREFFRKEIRPVE
jgi:hypothetical protein